MRIYTLFLALGALCASGGVYFVLRLVNEPNIGELIVLPIYIGFATGAAVICFTVALITYFLRKMK